jgi:hypothetical protein
VLAEYAHHDNSHRAFRAQLPLLTRGDDNRIRATAAEAIPTRIQHNSDGVAIVPTKPGDPSYTRVAEVLDRRGAVKAGLVIDSR